MSCICGLCNEGLKISVFDEEQALIFETIMPFEALLTMLEWWKVFNG